MVGVGVSLGAVWLGAGIGFATELRAVTNTEATGLRPVAAFADIKDPARRSAALFAEAGKVLLHARCVNCHPATDRPLQGIQGRPHEPRVRRGTDGHGVTAMRCAACHTAANYDAVGMPGNPHWGLAPASMAWEGRSLVQICEQIKDPARNGGRKLDAIVEHMRSDPLVGWAWAPGIGREPAPGTQAAFGALVQDWARTGAVCPGP
jgi:mono/diheme cytochrome c family protein